MYVLDLRWLGFALLLSVIAVGAAAVVVDPLVDEILRRHQSTLDVESETKGAETGTCVAFVLPAVEGSRHG